ncbi:hypothetical protein JCM10213v2_005421 [Rhodosporidiobolus nylandii]
MFPESKLTHHPTTSNGKCFCEQAHMEGENAPLVVDEPPTLVNLEGRNGVLEVTSVGKTIRTKRIEFRELAEPGGGPAKTGKQRQRRAATGGGEFMLPNNDFCDRCGGKGHFLCCEDGCLRSFHFQCLEPPLKIDKVPNESWYCKACQAAATQPEQPKGLSTNELAATSYAQQLQAQQTGFAGANGQSALQPQATGFA